MRYDKGTSITFIDKKSRPPGIFTESEVDDYFHLLAGNNLLFLLTKL